MNPTKRRNGKLWKRLILIAVVLLLMAAAIWIEARYIMILRARTPAVAYDPGVWFEVAPEGAVTAEGEPLSTRMRVGTENKVVVFFYGGGLSVNDFTASRPYTGSKLLTFENGFYTADIDGMIPDYLELGLGSAVRNNPFRDWTILVIPYATGDFHIGTADYQYRKPDGSTAVLHHHGYTNYRAIMDEAMAYLGGDPEELLITGYSAGGFGAALLGNYFPDAGHVTVCIDSSLMFWEHFGQTAREVWGAPEELCEKFRTENPIADLLGELYETCGDSVTYLFVSSSRDGELSRYQNYLNTGNYTVSNIHGRLYTAGLRDTIAELKRAVPTIGVYIFDRLPFSLLPSQMSLTQHTVLITPMAFWTMTDQVSPARWLYDAVNGNVRDHGLNLLR